MASIWKTTTVYKKFLKINDIKPNTVINLIEYTNYKFNNFKVITFLKSFEFKIEKALRLEMGIISVDFPIPFPTYKIDSNLSYEVIYIDNQHFKINMNLSDIVENSVKFDVIVMEDDKNE